MAWTIVIIALLGIIIAIIGFLIGKAVGTWLERMRWKQQLPDIRKKATQQSRAVIGGQVSEQLAPFLPHFPYNPSEARFIGKPVDFLVFKGMDNKHIEEVIFVEVKTGKSALSTQEQALKKAIENKRVSFYEYRV